MDIKTLYSLVAIADYGSFAEAARAVGLSLPRVSLQMRGLEEDTGLSIFDRSTRPPRLTEQGRQLVAQAREVLLHWEALTNRTEASDHQGLLRIGAVHTAVASLVPQTLRDLRQKSASIHFQLRTGLSHELQNDLRNGSIDCALITKPDNVSEDFDFRIVTEDSMILIAHKNMPGETVAELLEENPYVRFAREAWVSRLVDVSLSRRGIKVRSTMTADTLDGVVALVEYEHGVSIIPQIASMRSLPHSIKIVDFGDPPLKRRLGILQRKNDPRAHLIDLFYAGLIDMAHASEKKVVNA